MPLSPDTRLGYYWGWSDLAHVVTKLALNPFPLSVNTPVQAPASRLIAGPHDLGQQRRHDRGRDLTDHDPHPAKRRGVVARRQLSHFPDSLQLPDVEAVERAQIAQLRGLDVTRGSTPTPGRPLGQQPRARPLFLKYRQACYPMAQAVAAHHPLDRHRRHRQVPLQQAVADPLGAAGRPCQAPRPVSDARRPR